MVKVINFLSTSTVLLSTVFTFFLFVSFSALQAQDTDPCIEGGYVLSSAVTDASCHGATDGQVTIASTGCSCVFSGCTFAWSNGAQFHTIEELGAGSYTVTVTHPNGCILETSINIRQPESAIAIFDKQNVSCSGNNDGSIVIVPSENAGPLTYKWSNEMTDNKITSLDAGEYTVTITNILGCEQIEQLRIEEPPTPAIDFTSIIDACSGLDNGEATVTVTGGTPPYQYKWDDPQECIEKTAYNLPAGSYKVTITDANGCTYISQELSISEDGFIAEVNATNLSICVGEQARLVATGGISYSWLPNDGLSNPNISNPMASPDETTIYEVSVVNGLGCIATKQVKVEVEYQPQPVITTGTEKTICQGEQIQLIAIESAGANFSWSPLQGLTNANSNAPIASPEQTTVYTVKATNANGCVGRSSITINVDVCSSVEETIAKEGIAFYPNPSNGLVNIQAQLSSQENLQLQIFNSTGQLVQQQKYPNAVGSWQQTIDLSDFQAGIYYISLQMNDKIYSEKMLIY